MEEEVKMEQEAIKTPENEVLDGAGTHATEEKQIKTTKNAKEKAEKSRTRMTIKQRFSAKRIAMMAVFTALSFGISFLSFSLFPASPVFFLELDFGNVFILLISFLLGPVEGVIVCVLKEFLHFLSAIRQTNGVGELANVLMTSTYILLPSIVYRYKKGLKWVIPSLLAACIIGTVGALVANRCITFPLFAKSWEIGSKAFYESFWLIVAFNLIKTASISIITLLLYKRLSYFFKKWKI